MKKNPNLNNIKNKIDELLRKRYAIEKTDGFFKNIRICTGLFFLAFLSFLFVWYKNSMCILGYTGLIFALGVIVWCAWRKMGKLLPRFIWIGILGWFLLGSEMVTNLLVPDSWGINADTNRIESSDKKAETGTIPIMPIEKIIGFNYVDIENNDLQSSFWDIDNCLLGMIKSQNRNLNIIIYIFSILIFAFFIIIVWFTSLYRKHNKSSEKEKSNIILFFIRTKNKVNKNIEKK